MTSIVNLISATRNHFVDTVARMQTNGDPIVLCGAGYAAQVTWEFMQREHMRVDKVAIGGSYLRPGSEFNGFALESFEALAASGKTFNYIIAMQFADEALLTSLRQSASEMLFYDCAFVGVNTKAYFTFGWCEEHQQALTALYDQLGDERSKATLLAYLNQRISACEGEYGALYHPQHYFPQEIIALGDNEVFVDCGAFDGDSIKAFVTALKRDGAGEAEKIYAFEPDSTTFAQLQHNTADLPQCAHFQAGVWNEATTLYFNASNSFSSSLSDAPVGDKIDLLKIDDVTGGNRVSFIKMDIEGAELAALQGAQNTITRWQPTLAISLYHKRDDLLTIPQFIQQLHGDYRFYLRAHHPRLAYEMVLYAVPAAKVKA
ncbi:FkbM family methyltransferase [Kosakonia sp. BYX6]|uniref:FkbM family methyltransferase n=1 Tax=Kosakonia calanthes TaxID=3139408 RepID=A0ABZ3B9K3_9ENTR